MCHLVRERESQPVRLLRKDLLGATGERNAPDIFKLSRDNDTSDMCIFKILLITKQLQKHISTRVCITHSLSSVGDIGITLYEWHSPITSNKLDFGKYQEKELTLEERISANNNKAEPCITSGNEILFYKVLVLLWSFNIVDMYPNTWKKVP